MISVSRPGRAGQALVVSLLVVVALLALGCSDDSDGAGDTTDTGQSADSDAPPAGSEVDGADVPDPCSLLTTDDIDGATGVTFGEGTFNDTLSSEFQAICDWAATDDTFAAVQTLIIPDSSAFEGNRSSADSAVGPVTDVDIPGADSAYETSEGSIIGMVVGDLFLQVSYIPSGPGDVGDVTEQLAATAVANL